MALTHIESNNIFINRKPDFDKFKRYISDNIIPRNSSNTLMTDEVVTFGKKFPKP